jgi:hypothetical protein
MSIEDFKKLDTNKKENSKLWDLKESLKHIVKTLLWYKEPYKLSSRLATHYLEHWCETWEWKEFESDDDLINFCREEGYTWPFSNWQTAVNAGNWNVRLKRTIKPVFESYIYWLEYKKNPNFNWWDFM